MKTAAIPLPTAPKALLAKLRVSIPTAVVPAFEQALMIAQTRFNDSPAAFAPAAQSAGPPVDAHSLTQAIDNAVRDFRAKLIEATDALLPNYGAAKQAFNLSLIDDAQMQTQLVCERLVERLSYLQRKGLLALDQRLCKALELDPLGPRLPLSPQVFADAARAALAGIIVADEFKAQVIQDFDLLLDPILSDLLKDYNAGLAAAGILPHLIIQDEEERIRRQSITTPETAADSHEASLQTQAKPNTMVAAAANPAEPNYDKAIDEQDRALLNDLLAQMLSRQTSKPAPQHVMQQSVTLAMLDKLQQAGGNADVVLDAIGKPEGSIAETIKRELLQRAKQAGAIQDEEQTALAPEEDSAVELAGNLFEVMLKDRPYGDAVAPVLAEMVMPFVRAAIMNPQLFLERHHPARQLLNTVSEACEDNLGETPQERELLSQVETAVQQINEEFDGDINQFQRVEAQLSSQMQLLRRRVQVSEKRAGDSQQGQERLEIARLHAEAIVRGITNQYALPSTLRKFFNTEWQHHLSVTALRKGKDSEAFIHASRYAMPWIALLDMTSLGEVLPLSHLDTLETATLEVLASSGLQDDSALDCFQLLINAVSQWTEEIVTPELFLAAPVLTELDIASAIDNATPAPVVIEAVIAPAIASAAPAVVVDTLATNANQAMAPTEAELKEVSEYTVGIWLQLHKADGGFQQLKISWISGISGSLMLVNRRGARVLVLSPAELVDLKRRNELLIFEHESPVDQAMRQLLDKLKRE